MKIEQIIIGGGFAKVLVDAAIGIQGNHIAGFYVENIGTHKTGS